MSKFGKVTIQDVSQRARVSATTVSHALNGRGRVGAETRERIIKVAEEMGYRANPVARALKTGRAMTLMAELPQTAEESGLDSAFLRDVLVGAAESAVESGYVLAITGRSHAGTHPLSPLDGALIVDPVADDPLIETAAKLGLPLVTVSRLPAAAGVKVPAIISDYGAGMREILDHLESQRYRRPVLLSTRRGFDFAVTSAESFKEWMAEKGREPKIRYVSGAPSVSNGHTAMLALLAQRDPPDAVIATTEPLAMGAYQAVQETDRGMPEEIGLVAVVDSERLKTAAVPVTALDLFPTDIGRRAVALLVEQIESEKPHAVESVELPTQLNLRASTTR
jgi:DNA-binding LacI/PurR family transcriptional regulator